MSEKVGYVHAFWVNKGKIYRQAINHTEPYTSFKSLEDSLSDIKEATDGIKDIQLALLFDEEYRLIDERGCSEEICSRN